MTDRPPRSELRSAAGGDAGRLTRSVRAALADIVAHAPQSMPQPNADPAMPSPSVRPGRWVLAATGLTAAAGLVGVFVLRDNEPGQRGAATQPTTPPTAVTTAPPDSAPAGALPNQDRSPCGAAELPAGAVDVQTAVADVDGDAVDDRITLYRVDDVWHVLAESSVKGWASDAAVTLEVDDEATLTFENVDYSLGAEIPPPVAVMVTGSGDNDLGIIANFTFLTNTRDYCIAQWSYTPPGRPTEPFQWVARRAPGIATGMVCEGAAGSRHYYLYDSTTSLEGSWRVVTRRLTHDFTTAEIAFDPIIAVEDSPGFLEQYANIVGCDHPPV